MHTDVHCTLGVPREVLKLFKNDIDDEGADAQNCSQCTAT